MNNLPLIFLGVFFTLAASWTGLVLSSQIQLGDLEPMTAEYALDSENKPIPGVPMPDEDVYPRKPLGLAMEGKLVYESQGCMYCHSQQVRRDGFGSDFQRGWGARQSVARDYIRQDKVLLGTMRTGPDLANIGTRQRSEEWQHLHLYNSRYFYKNSTMPYFRYLYEKREMTGEAASPGAYALPAPDEGYEIVPSRRAEALVAYLISLQQDYDLPEAKRAE